MGVFINGREVFNNTKITNPDIDGGTIDNTTIGGSTPAAGSFTTLKQISGAGDGNIPVSDGTGNLTLTASTGTGAPVRATSPTLESPALGTPASGDLQNCTASTTSTKGVVELATDAEVVAGADTSRVVTPAGLAAKIGVYDIHEVEDLCSVD